MSASRKSYRCLETLHEYWPLKYRVEHSELTDGTRTGKNPRRPDTVERSAKRSTGVSPSTPFLPASRYSTKPPFLTTDKRKQYGEGELQRLWAKYRPLLDLGVANQSTQSGSLFAKSWSMNSATDAKRSTSVTKNLFFYV